MKFKTTATVAALVLAPFAAKAGNLSEPIERSIVPAPTPTTTDWSGAYVGLSYGFASGDYDFSQLAAQNITRDMDDGSLTQLFGGYQV